MKNKSLYRFSWVVAVLALAIVACTCGALPDLSQVTQGLETAQSVATQIGTAQALATQLPVSTKAGGGVSVGKAPDDIPVFPDNTQFFAIQDTVSYFTKADYKTVVDFYKKEMPNKGWKLSTTQKSVESNNASVFYYEKSANKSTVTISSDGKQTIVQVLINK